MSTSTTKRERIEKVFFCWWLVNWDRRRIYLLLYLQRFSTLLFHLFLSCCAECVTDWLGQEKEGKNALRELHKREKEKSGERKREAEREKLYNQRVSSNEAHLSTEFIQDHPAAGSRLFSRKLHIAGDFPYSTSKQNMSYFPQYTGINHFITGSAGTINNANYTNIGNMHDVQEDPQEPRVNTQKTWKMPSLFVLAHQHVRVSSETNGVIRSGKTQLGSEHFSSTPKMAVRWKLLNFWFPLSLFLFPRHRVVIQMMN